MAEVATLKMKSVFPLQGIIPIQRSFSMGKTIPCERELANRPVGSELVINREYLDGGVTKVYYYVKTVNGFRVEDRIEKNEQKEELIFELEM